MPERSDPTSNAEIVGNARAPKGFGRRGAICGVGAPRRYPGIACVAPPCIPPRGAPNDANAISDSGHP